MNKLSIDNTAEQNIQICMKELSRLRVETEKDDVEIYSNSFGFGTGLIRLCVVITRNKAWEYNLIHYQAIYNTDKNGKEIYGYVVDYQLKDAPVEEMMKYCLKYPYSYYAVRY